MMPVPDFLPSQGKNAVLRVSLGACFFFLLLLLTTAGAATRGGARSRWHAGWWPLKIVFYTGCLAIAFFAVPAPAFAWFAIAACVCSAIFLLFQLVALLDGVYVLNDWCVAARDARPEGSWSRTLVEVAMVLSTALLFGGSLAATVYMLVYLAPSATCSVNITALSLNLGLAAGYTAASVALPTEGRKGGLLTSAFVFAYCTWLCWAGLGSQPASACNSLPGASEASAPASWTVVAGFILAVLALCWQVQQLGIDDG